MEFFKCPRCHDDVQENAYGIHVSETCIAIGKSPEEVKAIQEANDEPFDMIAALAERTAEFQKIADLSYCDIDPDAMMDSDGSDY